MFGNVDFENGSTAVRAIFKRLVPKVVPIQIS